MERQYELLAVNEFSSARKRMSILVRPLFSSPLEGKGGVQAEAGGAFLFCKGADNVMFERASTDSSASLSSSPSRRPATASGGGVVEGKNKAGGVDQHDYVGYDGRGTSLDLGKTEKRREKGQVGDRGHGFACLNNHLRVFALDGLRTLVIGWRYLPPTETARFLQEYETAAKSMTGRKEALARAADSVERDLILAGATAIEDKLQDGVPETIYDLLKAGIKMWVLTGDKEETAVSIGFSSRLLDNSITLLRVNEETEEAVLAQLRDAAERVGLDSTALIEGMEAGRGGRGGESARGDDTHISPLPRPMAQDEEGEGLAFPAVPSDAQQHTTYESFALIVTGKALQILTRTERTIPLLTIARRCKVLIACRVSPSQKAVLVRLVKRNVKPRPVTLAIGDGANDVTMIQEAHVGVGISGKEGLQAVNASDFAIAQFRFLKRLLLVHGRYNYRRICKVVLYSFYKNIVIVTTLFFFQYYAVFSGSSIYDIWIYSWFNLVLGLPIIAVGLFDKDVKEATVLATPPLYTLGRDQVYMTIAIMIERVFFALLNGIIILFLGVTYSFPTDSGAIFVMGTSCKC